MNEQDVERRVIEILREQAADQKTPIARESRLFEIGDSLDRMEAIMAFEEEFEISISDEDQDRIQTVGELISFILASRENPQPATPT